ncbi:MAG: N-acetyltransferase [Pontiellaceae bacterium]|nr:N-acetyltransferase [Pontiellaceae bacterium]MBN2786456.1 N-acetyltransferase [Pontiellaceae bacterium]
MRHAAEQDLAAIVEIYNASIPSRLATADMNPISVDSRREWFHKHAPERYPLLIHEIDGKVAAWTGLHPYYERPAYLYTAEISIYVAPEFQGQRLGPLLINETLEAAMATGLKTIIALIFTHNERSLRLFRSCGFEDWGHLPDVTEMDGKEYSVTILGKRIRD